MAYETKEDAVRSRIKALQKEKGLTENGLAEGDTPAQKRLNRQLSHGAAITLDTLLRVLDSCPDVSSDWLLRGSGDMFTNNSAVAANKVTGKNATVIGQQATLSEDFVKGLLAEKDRQIQTLLSLLAK